MAALREPPAEREVSVPRLVIGACLGSAVLLISFILAGEHGLLPHRIIATIEGQDSIPSTTDPTTMASGAIPINASQCALVKNAPGGLCVLVFEDVRGNLVQQTLAVPVPSSWLSAEPQFDQPNNAQVLADLTRTHFAPSGRGLSALPISVDPAFAQKLQAAGVSPESFLQWLYTNVPAGQRPPWVQPG